MDIQWQYISGWKRQIFHFSCQITFFMRQRKSNHHFFWKICHILHKFLLNVWPPRGQTMPRSTQPSMPTIDMVGVATMSAMGVATVFGGRGQICDNGRFSWAWFVGSFRSGGFRGGFAGGLGATPLGGCGRVTPLSGRCLGVEGGA